MKIVAIDFETAAGRNAACSVGVFVFGDTKTISEHHLINPEINDDEWDSFAMTIHGISPSMVKKSANFKKVWERVEEISKDAVLLANSANSVKLSVCSNDNSSLSYLIYHLSNLFGRI